MTIYFIIFGFAILTVELGLRRMKVTFYFLNFMWGKALFDFFIGIMSISGGIDSWVEIPIAIFFFAATICLLLIAICYRKEERERVAKEIDNLGVEKKKEEEFSEHNMPPGGF